MAFLSSALNAIQGSYHQVNPFDGGRTYATNAAAAAKYDNPKKSSGGGGTGSTGGGSTYDASAAIAALNKQIQQQNASYQAILAQQAAMPKLPYYDTAAAYASAQKTATAAVDPVYQDKLNQFLQQSQLDRNIATRKQGDTEAAANTGLTNTLADIETNRTRTAQDETTQIGDTQQSEQNYQENSGTAFDRARNALVTGVANAGLTTSGLGQGQVAAATSDRNTADKQQTQTFENTRRDIHTNATRTFEDLATSGSRAQESTATTIKQSKQDLQDFIDNAALGEQSFRTSNEEARQNAIAGATDQAYKTSVQQFIASLVGSGARAQDIALAAQVYG